MIYDPLKVELNNIKNMNEIISLKIKYKLTGINLLKNLYYLYDNVNNLEILINKNKLNIIYFNYEISLYNFKGYSYLIENINLINNNAVILEYLEGTKFYIFYFNKIWNIVHNNQLLNNKSLIYQAFFKQIKPDLEKININNIYYFMYIDSHKKNIIDYSNKYGSNYKNLIFLYYIHKNIKYYNDKLFNKNTNISILYKYNNISEINLENDKFDFSERPISKGVIIINNKTILKLQTFKYQFYKATGPEKHVFNGFIDLYKKGKLIKFIKNNNTHSKFNKIINPYNDNEKFDTIGCIDSLFKNISNEIYNIYINFFCIKTNKNKYNHQYKYLPLHYKKIIGYSKKNNFISVNDFYNYLKRIDIKLFLNLVKARKLFNNWITINKEDFSYIFYKNNKLRNKLAAVYVTKIFPNIIKSDINYKK